MPHTPDDRRSIPQVDRLVTQLATEAPEIPRPLVVQAVRAVVDAARAGSARVEPGEVLEQARREMNRRRSTRLRSVVNVTGVVLHTNLGRAPLHHAALDAVREIAGGYSNLELDLGTGRRGDRFGHVEPNLALLTGAQAALVVNNNAAAVLLVCAALAKGREVVISRGELIEIGGEFRIPEVLEQSGATLVEVGTTNRTHLRDYASALGERCALVLKVHPSNYRVVGFTASPPLPEVAALAHERSVPLVYDAGSGLVGTSLADEPVVERVLADGADLVTFSGDKLLGGPQAGVVCGNADLVAQLRRHPLLRALRPDKMTIAALGATVDLYLQGERDSVPVWRMLTASVAELRDRCEAVAGALRATGVEAVVGESTSVAGGGSLPGVGIETPVVRLTGDQADVLAGRLRAFDPPVLARVEDDAVILDLRTAAAHEDDVICAAVCAAFEDDSAVDSRTNASPPHHSK